MHAMVAQSALVKRPAALRKYVAGSVAAHVLLVAAVLGYSHLALPAQVDLNQKPIRATLVRLGKPREERLLPRKETPPPPPQKVEKVESPVAPTPAPPAPAAVPVPVPGAKPAPAAKKQEGTTDGDRRSRLFSAFSKSSKATSLEELAGQADGDPDGDAAQAEGERYYGMLRAQVQRRYNVSQTIPEQERLHLRARVRLRIGAKGELLHSELTQPSGNSLFDTAVIQAIKKAADFSPPPKHLLDSLQREGVVMEFSP